MRLIRVLFIAVLGLVVVLGAAIFLIPTERLAKLAASQFEATTGRELSIGGEIGLSVFPVLGARAKDISIGNPDWAGEGELLRAAEMDIGVDLMSLFSGAVVVERVVLQSPVVILRRAADGRTTWDFAQPGGAEAQTAAEGAPEGAIRALSLAEARIVNGTLRYVDEMSGTELDLGGLDATLTMPDMNGPLSLDASARLGGQPVAVALRAGNATGLLGGQLTTLVVNLEIADAEASFEGRAALSDLVLEGRAQGKLAALAPVLAALGQPGSELPKVYRPVSFDGQITHTENGQLFLREIAATAGNLSLGGAADVTFGGQRPVVSAQFSIPVLDLRGMTGRADSDSAAEQGWSREPIDASALGALDGDIVLSIGELRSGSGSFGPIHLRTEIDNARAVTNIREARLFDGDVSGQVIVNNRAGLSLRAVLNASGISLLPLLRDTAEFERLNGTAQAQIDLLGSGSSLYAIMNSLQGQGSWSFAQGEILGFDLAGMLRNLDPGHVGEGRSTIYNSITGSFTMAGGVLNNEDLKLDAPYMQVEGRGQVGVGAQTLDYRIVPSALRDAEGNALRVPLIVTGPWSAPRFRLDMEALARERLEEERERLEALAREEAQRLEERARAEAEARIQQELGVQRQEGESLEDTLRRGIEGRITEELGRGLQGLLGGN